MARLTQEELKVILEAHQKWLVVDLGNTRANLYEANLYEANLSKANLSRADLSRANLSKANLSRANLYGANLSGANLSRADFSGADLYGANLYGANLYGANLSGANLSKANLSRADFSGANLSKANLPHFQICPEEGDFIAWKAVRGGAVIKLLVPKEAKRTSSLVGRNCRAEFVIVLNGYGVSIHDQDTTYGPGLKIIPDKYDDDIRVECTSGIHFFMTKREAEEYA